MATTPAAVPQVYSQADEVDAPGTAAPPQSSPSGQTYSASDEIGGDATPGKGSVTIPDKGLLGAYEKALNTDASKVIPFTGLLGGLAQGALKAADKAVLGTADVINQHFNWGAGGPPIPTPSDETRRALTENNLPGQGTGGFLGDAAMFALPAGEVGAVMKGAPLAARLLAQAGVGAGVSAAQNSGNPAATVTGAVLGGAGELVPAAVKGVVSAAKDVQPTLENFAKSFAATPLQKGVISETLPTLVKEGVKPTLSVPEMAAAIDAKLAATPVPPKALTVDNYARSFGATPTQTKEIGKALPTLMRDGITPAETSEQMRDSIKSKLAELGAKYEQQATDMSPVKQRDGSTVYTTLGDREIDANEVVGRLRKLQSQFVGGVKQVSEEAPTGVVDSSGRPITTTKTRSVPLVTNANQPYYDKIGKEIEDAKDFASANNGSLTFDNVRHLRDGANGRTNWQAAPADQNLYKDVGNAYRQVLDKIAPETTQLNRDYATYKNLHTLADENASMRRGVDAKPDLWEGQEDTPYAHYRALQDLAQKNLAEGRGTTQSGLDRLMHRAQGGEYGLALGSELGHAVAGLPGAVVGGGIGMYAVPRLAGPIVQALRNISDSGALTNASPAAKRALEVAIRTGKSDVIKRAIQGVSRKAATSVADTVTTPAQ